VFAQAREKGRQAACLSNLKQIGTGLRMYMQDWDELAPLWGTPSVPGVLGRSGYRACDDPQSLAAVLNPYIKNYGIWICPSNTVEERMNDPEGKRNTYVTPLTWADVTDPFKGEKQDPNNPDISGITFTPVAFDNYQYRNYTAPGALGNPSGSANTIPRPYKFPHQSLAINELYLDGHAKVKVFKK